jgi:hypothetical protein
MVLSKTGGEYVCKLCDDSRFTASHLLARHIGNTHLMKAERDSLAEFHCERCQDKLFDAKLTLGQHLYDAHVEITRLNMKCVIYVYFLARLHISCIW